MIFDTIINELKGRNSSVGVLTVLLLPASHSPTQVYYKLTGCATTQLITEIPSTHIHTSTILQEEVDDDEHDDVCPGSVINGGVAEEDHPN